MNINSIIRYIKPKTHATVKDALVHWAKKFVQLAVYVTAIVILGHWLNAGDNVVDAMPVPGKEPAATAPALPQPKTVLDTHKKECWTGKQKPKADLPGAAIVKFTNGKRMGDVEYVTNDTTRGFKLVDAAFNEALAMAGFGDKISQKIDPVALCI